MRSSKRKWPANLHRGRAPPKRGTSVETVNGGKKVSAPKGGDAEARRRDGVPRPLKRSRVRVCVKASEERWWQIRCPHAQPSAEKKNEVNQRAHRSSPAATSSSSKQLGRLRRTSSFRLRIKTCTYRGPPSSGGPGGWLRIKILDYPTVRI